jgi:HD-like signal output (HDOD) protein
MKPRGLLSATELATRIADLERRLDHIGLNTQPEVAARVVDLVARSDAQPGDYAKVIKTDPALSGRLLKAANSAFFAQRQPVTTLERACVLLGLERLKSVSLGFYLSRSAADPEGRELSKRVWGQSVFRACLSAEVARLIAPSLTSEAFVVGLMLDAGIPLLSRLVGEDRYAAMILNNQTPAALFRAELRELPWAHPDIMSVLTQRWRLPAALAKPIVWHHQPPPETAGASPANPLHRVAYYAGAVDLHPDTATPRERIPLSSVASRLLGATAETLERMIGNASREYEATRDLFAGVAQSIADVDTLKDRVHDQLISELDRSVEALLAQGVLRVLDISVSSQRLRIQPDVHDQRRAVAYLIDSQGDPVLSFSFQTATETAATLLDSLSIAGASQQEVDQLDTYLRLLAA